MWYAVVINTDAEKAFRYLLYTRAGGFWSSKVGKYYLLDQNHLLAESEGGGEKTYPSFAVRVTSTASGGQKSRTGANREVPSPAETCTGTLP